MKDETIPEYYKGKNGYMAKDVVSNFDLSYNRTGALSPTGVRK